MKGPFLLLHVALFGKMMHIFPPTSQIATELIDRPFLPVGSSIWGRPSCLLRRTCQRSWWVSRSSMTSSWSNMKTIGVIPGCKHDAVGLPTICNIISSYGTTLLEFSRSFHSDLACEHIVIEYFPVLPSYPPFVLNVSMTFSFRPFWLWFLCGIEFNFQWM